MKRFFTAIFLWITFLSFQNNLFGGEMPRYYQPQAFSYISSIVPTADNGFIILGYFKSLPTDMFRPKVVKFDQRGEFQWERSFNNFPLADFSAVDEGLFYKTPDNGYLIVNTYPSTTNNGRYGLIRKYNSNYDSVYSVFTVLDSIGLDESFLNGWNLSVNKIVPTADGGFAIAGSNLKDCYNKGYVLAIYSNTGHLTWKENTPLTNGCIQFRYDAVIAEKTQTGGFLFGIANRGQVAPNQYNGVFDIVKKNSAGVTVWAKTFVTQYDVSQVANKNVLLTQKELPNGNVKFLTVYDIYGGNYTGGTFLQYTLSPSGTIIQTDTFSFNLPLANYENLRKIVIDKDENILILGQKSFTKLDKKGRVLWQRQPFDELRIYDSPGTKSHFTCFTETPDGNYILGGNTTQTTNTNNSTGVLFYITGDGKMKTKILYGGVYIDADNSCSYNNEKTYPNLIVKAEKYNQTFYTITDTAGLYNLPVDTGIYKVSFQLPNAVYWKYCQLYYTANLTSSSPALNIALPVQQRVSCPFMNVEVATPYLRKCFQNTYSVYYCNSGTDTAKNSYITVDFDADLLVNSSTLPWASVNGNQYRFNIGNVPPQTCGSFKVYVTVSCSATDGKTHCVTAHVYPDQSCVAPSNLWDGSNITINGICNGDTAVFKISNIGTGNMISPRRYIVIEGDFLRVMPQNFQLNANDSLVIRVPANGKTVRVQAQQDPNFPYPSLPASVIESCSGNIDSLNLVNQFPQDDGAAFLSTSCVQNRNSYDPNEKSAQPVGYLERHVVTHDDEIKYTLHFQNTGTDTAHSVVILDTLSPALDLTSLVMGASSHNYTYAVFGGNILQVNFPGIQLPDSNVNAEGSNGFVSFHVQPRKDVPNGTMATNTAQIYFDFNAAISTNQVYHTIDSIQYRITAVILNKNIIADLRVYPNPFAGKTTIELKSEKILKDIELRVLDITGKLIQNRNAEMRFELDASEFTNGIYLLQLTSGGEIIATAKIVKQ